MEITQRVGQSDYAQKIQKKAQELINNNALKGTDKITTNEIAELAAFALKDDGQITTDELEVINSALASANGGMQLKSIDFKNSVSFQFKVSRNGKDESTVQGKLDTKAGISSDNTINKKDQAYIKDKTGMEMDMSGWSKDAGEIRTIIDGLLKANGFDANAYKNNTNGYADRLQSAIKDLIPSKAVDPKEFCDIMFGVKPITLSKNGSGEVVSKEVGMLQAGLKGAGLSALLSQDGSQAIDGKLGLRTATAIDRLFAVVSTAGDLGINIPKDKNVVVFTDDSASMHNASDQVANATEDMKKVALAKGSTFTLVEGYNHSSGDERHIQTALDFIKKGAFEDTNGSNISAPKNGKPMQIIFQTDANLDIFKKEDLQELIKECKGKNIDFIIQNPSTGGKISLDAIIAKVCAPNTTDIDPALFNKFVGKSDPIGVRTFSANIFGEKEKPEAHKAVQEIVDKFKDSVSDESITIKNSAGGSIEMPLSDFINKYCTGTPPKVNQKAFYTLIKDSKIVAGEGRLLTGDARVSITKPAFDFNLLNPSFGMEGRRTK